MLNSDIYNIVLDKPLTLMYPCGLGNACNANLSSSMFSEKWRGEACRNEIVTTPSLHRLHVCSLETNYHWIARGTWTHNEDARDAAKIVITASPHFLFFYLEDVAGDGHSVFSIWILINSCFCLAHGWIQIWGREDGRMEAVLLKMSPRIFKKIFSYTVYPHEKSCFD